MSDKPLAELNTAELITPIPREEIRNILEKLSASLRKYFAAFHPTTTNDVLSNFIPDPSRAEFALSFWIRGEWLGMGLRGPSLEDLNAIANLIDFSLYSPESGIGATASLLAYNQRGLGLYHNGISHHKYGNLRPHSSILGKYGDRTYYLVSQIESNSLFSDIVNFHFSRYSIHLDESNFLGDSKGGPNPGSDPGAAAPHERIGVWVSCRSRPITQSLLAEVESLGFSVEDGWAFRPDLVVAKGDRRVLFEIKPSSSLHDIICGIGQLLVYDKDIHSTHRMLVCPKLPDTKAMQLVLELMADHDIQHLECQSAGEDYLFPTMHSALR